MKHLTDEEFEELESYEESSDKFEKRVEELEKELSEKSGKVHKAYVDLAENVRKLLQSHEKDDVDTFEEFLSTLQQKLVDIDIYESSQPSQQLQQPAEGVA